MLGVLQSSSRQLQIRRRWVACEKHWAEVDCKDLFYAEADWELEESPPIRSHEKRVWMTLRNAFLSAVVVADTSFDWSYAL